MSVRHLFLQGPARVGKSSLLREALAPVAERTRGFTVQRLFEGASVAGYRVVLVNGLLPPLEAVYRPGLKGVFLCHGRRDVSVLEEALLAVEQAVDLDECAIVLLDEIGGVELESPVFLETLYRILTGPKPCVGVFKSAGNLRSTAAHYRMAGEYSAKHRELEALLRVRGELLNVTAEDPSALRAYVTAHIRAQTRGAPA